MLPIVNYKGELVSSSAQVFGFDHVAILQSEILKEHLRLYQGRFLFEERHYFHLMAQMRMARMPIPMHFTPAFFHDELAKLKDEFALDHAKFTFCVSQNMHDTDFWITAIPMKDALAFDADYEIEQYRETHVANGFHQRMRFSEPRNRVLKTFAFENDYQDLLLLNEQKSIARCIDGNLFVIKGDSLLTPRLEDGALDSVFRDKMLEACKRAPHLDDVKEEAIFPFSLMKADEIFVLKDGEGAYAVSKFRKKEFVGDIMPELIAFFVELE